MKDGSSPSFFDRRDDFKKGQVYRRLLNDVIKDNLINIEKQRINFYSKVADLNDRLTQIETKIQQYKTDYKIR